jgi:hypothetical protein
MKLVTPLLFLVPLLVPVSVSALSSGVSFSINGYLADNGVPATNSHNFVLSVWDSVSCYVYTESQTQDLSMDPGYFSLIIGSGTGAHGNSNFATDFDLSSTTIAGNTAADFSGSSCSVNGATANWSVFVTADTVPMGNVPITAMPMASVAKIAAGASSNGFAVPGSSSGTVTLQAPATSANYNFTFPASGGTNGYALTTNGSGLTSWTPMGVTSVGLTLPSIFSSSSTPVTSSGTLMAVLNSELANTVLAGPSSASGTPVFRTLVAADIPSLPFSAISGTVPISQGGTGAATSAAAITNLGAAASGANADITSMTKLITITAPSGNNLNLKVAESTNGLTLTSSGVGIANTSQIGVLDVGGLLHLGPDNWEATGNNIEMERNDDTSTLGVYFADEVTDFGLRKPIGSDNLSFSSEINGGLVDFLTFTPTGSVGIGTSTPSAELQVVGHIASSNLSGTSAPLNIACGTGASLSTGASDTRGTVTTGTPTSCTITFAESFPPHHPVSSAFQALPHARSMFIQCPPSHSLFIWETIFLSQPIPNSATFACNNEDQVSKLLIGLRRTTSTAVLFNFKYFPPSLTTDFLPRNSPMDTG